MHISRRKTLSMIAAGIGGLGFVTPAAAQSSALTKEQSAALAAYDKALREFKAILAQRRAQIDGKKKLPSLPGRHVVPTYHPSAALRFGPAGEPRRLLRVDLGYAAELAARP